MRPMYLLLGSFVPFYKIISYSFEYLYMHLTKCCDFFLKRKTMFWYQMCVWRIAVLVWAVWTVRIKRKWSYGIEIGEISEKRTIKCSQIQLAMFL